MEAHKVSVIMPSLNVKDYIGKCLDSVCHQTLKNIEIICVDAGSTDGTEEIIKEYALKDSRINVIHSGVKSYGYQVNLGISKAKGKYIAILETDDYADLDMYESLYAIAETTGCDYVKANFHRFYTDSDGEKVFIDSDLFAKSKDSYDQILEFSKHLNIVRFDTNVWSGIYKRDFLLENKIKCNESPGAAYQDIGFLQQVFWSANKVYYTQRAFYNYCMDREDSSTNRGNGLRFAYQEYQFLLKLVGKIKSEQKNFIYERMADVFEENLKKALTQNNEEDNTYIISWFINVLSKKESEGIIQREYLLYLGEDTQTRLNQYKQQLISQRILKQTAIEQLYDMPVVIFGAGSRGKVTYRELIENNIQIVGFCDNNQNLWGQRIGKTKIYSPQEVIQKYSDAKFVIANKFNSNEIKAQLIMNEIKESNIFYLE